MIYWIDYLQSMKPVGLFGLIITNNFGFISAYYIAILI